MVVCCMHTVVICHMFHTSYGSKCSKYYLRVAKVTATNLLMA